jgi:hypothetical protein
MYSIAEAINMRVSLPPLLGFWPMACQATRRRLGEQTLPKPPIRIQHPETIQMFIIL